MKAIVLHRFRNNLSPYYTPGNAYHVTIHVHWACASTGSRLSSLLSVSYVQKILQRKNSSGKTIIHFYIYHWQAWLMLFGLLPVNGQMIGA